MLILLVMHNWMYNLWYYNKSTDCLPIIYIFVLFICKDTKMIINNFSEFSNLVMRCNLQGISPFSSFISLVNDYKAHCNCVNPTEKSIKRDRCVDAYVRLVNTTLSSYMTMIKSVFKSGPITFSNNGKVIKTY